MILMGQEFGESWGLGFRRSDFLRSRFVGTSNYQTYGDALVTLYSSFIHGRLDPFNHALTSANRYFLRPTSSPNNPDQRIFAEAKWTNDGNVVFAFHNLWQQNVSQSYFIPPDIAAAMLIDDSMQYRLVDILGMQQKGSCHSGADLKYSFYVSMDSNTVAQWLRLEQCN